jgi:hypothetical protein
MGLLLLLIFILFGNKYCLHVYYLKNVKRIFHLNYDTTFDLLAKFFCQVLQIQKIARRRKDSKMSEVIKFNDVLSSLERVQ